LARHGLSLRKAREILERLAVKRPAVVELSAAEPAAVLSDLEKLGVSGAVFEVPDVDVKAVREGQLLSQPDFAHLYGLEVDTVRNWEQGRYAPDGPAKVLLSVIDSDPEAVIRALLRRQTSDKAPKKPRHSQHGKNR
jgi:DNA-binding transcriptional regulator YiaG